PLDRLDQLLDHRAFFHLVEKPQHTALAQARQRAPQLRLEDDQRRDRTVLEQHLHQVLDQDQVEQPRREVDQHEQHEPEQHLHRPRPRQQPQHVVEASGDDDDLGEVLQAREQEGEPLEQVSHGELRRASATVRARRTASTSCTRKRRAPRWSATTQAAIVPSSRSAGGSPPASSPTNRLRDGPTSTGRPSARILSSCAITATLCSVRLEKPSPGSSTMAEGGSPAAAARPSAPASSSTISPTGSAP